MKQGQQIRAPLRPVFWQPRDHAGTHIDALSHVAEDLTLYGGEQVTFRTQTPTGFTRLGAETIPAMLSRGSCWISHAIAGSIGLPPINPSRAGT